MQSIQEFIVSEQSQMRFAQLTGDWNPIHVDRTFAQRSTFGDAVVHGMNTALTALELYRHYSLADGRDAQRRPVGLTIHFSKPVFMNESLHMSVLSDDGRRVRCVVRAGQTEVMKFALTFVPLAPTNSDTLAALPPGSRTAPPKRPPVARNPVAGAGLQLTLPLSVDAEALSMAYPLLIDWLGEARVAAMALLSTVVGMEWPGAHSLFTSAKIDFLNTHSTSPEFLKINVIAVSALHSMTTTRVECSQFVAETEAFFRPPSVPRPTTHALLQRIGAQPFEGWTAIVVGGSRGLGEVVAKLMAAGGAEVILTYREARAEATDVVKDIQAAGRHATLLQFDASKGGFSLPGPIRPGRPVLIFYSASPHIFRRRTTSYSRRWLDEFLTIYVDGFIDVVSSVKTWTSGPISVLYPSSQALDAPLVDLIEYSAAKAAGEAVCQAMATDKRLRFVTPRLPRLLTDQTNSIVNVETVDSIDVLLPILKQLVVQPSQI